MDYGIIQPPSHLAGYVRFYWFVEGDLPYVHHAFAYPCSEFIFCYKGHFKYGLEHGKDTLLTSGIFGQTGTFSRVILNNEHFGIFGVHLYPHAFPQLFRVPANELSNQNATFRSVLGKDGEMLEDKMMLASGNAQRAKLVSNFLEARLKNERTELSSISSAITSIVNAYHIPAIQSLADSSYLSLRQFERRFKELSGFSPKSFLRIMRFYSVLNKDFQHKSLTEIGMACGYYDQSHFIHDFQKFSGISPGEYFRKEMLAAAGRGTVEL